MNNPTPSADVLLNNSHLLPNKGKALDLACGRGGNALLMAQHGLEVDAWDWDTVALEALKETAASQSLALHALKRDVEKHPPDAGSFDVICVSHFLHRPTLPALCEALRPGGLLFYQTFTAEKTTSGGPRNPDFLLAPNELLQAFADLRIRVYREEGLRGDTTQGWRNKAMLVASRED